MRQQQIAMDAFILQTNAKTQNLHFLTKTSQCRRYGIIFKEGSVHATVKLKMF